MIGALDHLELFLIRMAGPETPYKQAVKAILSNPCPETLQAFDAVPEPHWSEYPATKADCYALIDARRAAGCPCNSGPEDSPPWHSCATCDGLDDLAGDSNN